MLYSLKARTLASALVIVVGAGRALGQHEHKGQEHGQPDRAAPLPKCPVLAEPVNLGISTATPDGPVFFCCPDCVAKYQAEPGKYVSKVTQQRQVLADRPKVQVVCPVCQEPADPKIAMESGGQKVSFSSTECMNKYKADPAKYASALANTYTYQTKCPVTGESIDPKVSTTLANGAKIYFCCDACPKKLFADPAKYAPKLAEQGFTFDPKELTPAPSDKRPDAEHKEHEHHQGD